MKKDSFIKTKLDVYNVDERSECESVPDTLRDKYPALSARFIESVEAKNAKKAAPRKKSMFMRNIALIGATVACVAVVAVVLPVTLIDGDRDGMDLGSGPAGDIQYMHSITLEYLVETYDALLPADRDGITCLEYRYNRSDKVAYVVYGVDTFTAHILLDGSYGDEHAALIGLTNDGETELFTYKYKIEQTYSEAVFDYSGYRYHVVYGGQSDPQTFFALLDSLKPAGTADG